MPAKIDMIGKTFGQLTVLSEMVAKTGGRIRYLCQCRCGEITGVLGEHLRSGAVRSCGCLRNEGAKERAAKKASFRRGYKKL